MKSILYFDERKVFSLSSQIFSGVTEYIIKESTTSSTDSETQKGTIASGKVLAGAISAGGKDVEKRVMHDHAFSLFEKEIERQTLVTGVDVSYVHENISNLLAKPFVRISAPARIFDVKKIVDIMDDFNGIGRALAYTQSKKAVDELSARFEDQLKATKDQTKLGSLRKQKAKAIEELIDSGAKDMHQDPLFLQALSRDVSETVDLSTLRGRTAIFVDQVPGTSRLIAISAVGDTFPLHCSANGKALLACLPPDRVRTLVEGRMTAMTEQRSPGVVRPLLSLRRAAPGT